MSKRLGVLLVMLGLVVGFALPVQAANVYVDMGGCEVQLSEATAAKRTLVYPVTTAEVSTTEVFSQGGGTLDQVSGGAQAVLLDLMAKFEMPAADLDVLGPLAYKLTGATDVVYLYGIQVVAHDPYADIAEILTDTGTGGVVIVNDGITAAKLATGCLTSDEFAADAIVAATLATGAISADAFAVDAIVAATLATGAISADAFAADALAAGSFATGAFTADAYAADALIAATFNTGAFTADAFAADALANATFATGAFTADAFAADALVAATFATDSIAADAIADNAIDAGALAADCITTAELATDCISADEVADNAIDAGALAANCITTAEIATDAITSDELAATGVAEVVDAVWDEATASHVTAGTSGKELGDIYDDVATTGVVIGAFGADSITAAVIQDGAIDAATFATAAITADAIATDAIGAAEVAAGAATEIAAAVAAESQGVYVFRVHKNEPVAANRTLYFRALGTLPANASISTNGGAFANSTNAPATVNGNFRKLVLSRAETNVEGRLMINVTTTSTIHYITIVVDCSKQDPFTGRRTGGRY